MLNHFKLNLIVSGLVDWGIRDIWLTSNPAAIPFWRAVGFAETGEKAEFNDYPVMVKSV